MYKRDKCDILRLSLLCDTGYVYFKSSFLSYYEIGHIPVFDSLFSNKVLIDIIENINKVKVRSFHA